MEQKLKKADKLDKELLKEAKRLEFPDTVIARFTGKTEEEIRDMRYEWDITAAFKMVDTCAAEFASETPYYYSCFDSINEVELPARRKYWYLVPDRSVSVRVLNLTIALYTAYGHWKKKDMRPLLSTITRRQ